MDIMKSYCRFLVHVRPGVCIVRRPTTACYTRFLCNFAGVKYEKYGIVDVSLASKDMHHWQISMLVGIVRPRVAVASNVLKPCRWNAVIPGEILEHEHSNCLDVLGQIAKALGSTSIRLLSATFASNQCLVNVDPRVFTPWVISYGDVMLAECYGSPLIKIA